MATDGSAAHARALLDEADPDRAAVASFTVHSATLDDVFLSLTGHPATPDDAPDPARPAGSGVSAPRTSANTSANTSTNTAATAATAATDEEPARV